VLGVGDGDVNPSNRASCASAASCSFPCVLSAASAMRSVTTPVRVSRYDVMRTTSGEMPRAAAKPARRPKATPAAPRAAVDAGANAIEKATAGCLIVSVFPERPVEGDGVVLGDGVLLDVRELDAVPVGVRVGLAVSVAVSVAAALSVAVCVSVCVAVAVAVADATAAPVTLPVAAALALALDVPLVDAVCVDDDDADRVSAELRLVFGVALPVFVAAALADTVATRVPPAEAVIEGATERDTTSPRDRLGDALVDGDGVALTDARPDTLADAEASGDADGDSGALSDAKDVGDDVTPLDSCDDALVDDDAETLRVSDGVADGDAEIELDGVVPAVTDIDGEAAADADVVLVGAGDAVPDTLPAADALVRLLPDVHAEAVAEREIRLLPDAAALAVTDTDAVLDFEPSALADDVSVCVETRVAAAEPVSRVDCVDSAVAETEGVERVDAVDDGETALDLDALGDRDELCVVDAHALGVGVTAWEGETADDKDAAFVRVVVALPTADGETARLPVPPTLSVATTEPVPDGDPTGDALREMIALGVVPTDLLVLAVVVACLVVAVENEMLGLEDSDIDGVARGVDDDEADSEASADAESAELPDCALDGDELDVALVETDAGADAVTAVVADDPGDAVAESESPRARLADGDGDAPPFGLPEELADARSEVEIKLEGVGCARDAVPLMLSVGGALVVAEPLLTRLSELDAV
jgi:hypothetical protein